MITWRNSDYLAGLSKYSQGLQILPPNVTVQIYVVSIYDICEFFKNFTENLNLLLFFFEIPSPVVGGCQSTLIGCEL